MEARHGRWQPALTILNLPWPSRRRRSAATQKRNLGDLLIRVRSVKSHSRPAVPPGENGGDSGGEERWRFQAEILRAECNFLRMEREVALRKLERNRVEVEVALSSAIETLISGRKKIDGSGSLRTALDEGIEELEEKLEDLRIRNRGGRRSSMGSSRTVMPRDCARNFDRQASVLRRRLEKMEDDASVKDIQAISVMPAFIKNDAEPEEDEQDYATPGSSHIRRLPNEMEILRKKMEGLSKGMLERMEECNDLLSVNNNCSAITTSSNKSECNGGNRRPIGSSEAADKSPLLQIQQQEQPEKLVEEKMEPSCCNCNELVGRIMQQVRAESEQWIELQEMLNQVRTEMEELRSSRDHWQRRAISSEINSQSQHTQLEWKQRARSSERKVIELQKLVKELQKEVQPLRTKLLNAPPSSPLHLELPGDSLRMAQNQQIRSLASLKEKENDILVCHLKTQNNSSRRWPLQGIDNISPLLRLRRGVSS